MTAVAIALALGWVYTAERWGPTLLVRWDRYIALRETAQATTQRAQREALKPSVVIPDDLEAVIAEESAQFARDELRAAIKDRYAEFGSWNKVRRAVGIGEMEDVR